VTYLLDTDTVSYALRGVHDIGRRLLEHSPNEIAISSVTEAELLYGAKKRNSSKLKKTIGSFIKPIEVLPFDSAAAASFADIAVKLEKKGSPLGVTDLMIAAVAITNDRILVTNNTKHFNRVTGLKIENWVT